MKPFLVCVALIIGQTNALQERQVVHLQPHSGAIRPDFGGKLLELLNAPAVVYLPMAPPKAGCSGKSMVRRHPESGIRCGYGGGRVPVQLANHRGSNYPCDLERQVLSR